MGENLAVLWSTYTAEFARAGDLLGRMSQCWIVSHHDFGVTGYLAGDSDTYANFNMLNQAGVLPIFTTSDAYIASITVVAQNAPITVNGLTGYGFEAFDTTGGVYCVVGFAGFGGIGPFTTAQRKKRPCDDIMWIPTVIQVPGPVPVDDPQIIEKT